jgi:hypothetical protein
MKKKLKLCSFLLLALVILLAGSVMACVPSATPTPPTVPPPTPAPAKFTVSAFSVVPDTCKAGESVTVSATVTNSGGSKGIYSVVFKVNGTEEARMEVTLDAGGSQKVSYTLKKAVAGTYSVDVNGLAGTFVVRALPKPAAFTVSALTISLAKVAVKEAVTISALVQNTGDISGSYEVVLKVNGVKVDAQTVTLAGGTSQRVTFTTSRDVAGTYSVEVNGLTSSFVVAQPVTPDIVYITRTGEKYHRAGCRYLSQSCIPIERAEAIRRGYTPCSVCRP